LQVNGLDITPEAVLADVIARDARDAGRAEAPMIAAPDAVFIDTSDMTIEAAVAKAVEIITAALR
jgi:CMP/dCMP kinase